MRQTSIFDPTAGVPPGRLPEGLSYTTDFITPAEEAALLATFRTLPFKEAKYQQYTARRRTVNYGAGYDFSHKHTIAAPPLPDFLRPLIEQAAAWAQLPANAFIQALLAEYQPGTPLGWHRDVPDYELIFGLSLAGPGRIRFRPYPWEPERKKEMFAIELEPRSAYILRGPARWQWQHHVPPAKVLRYSITLRTQRQ